LNARESIGFPEPSAERGFELIAELRRQRQAEIARISGIATRLAARFGAETVVGFLYYEILVRPPIVRICSVTPSALTGHPQ